MLAVQPEIAAARAERDHVPTLECDEGQARYGAA